MAPKSRQEKRRALLAKKAEEVSAWGEVEAVPQKKKEPAIASLDRKRRQTSEPEKPEEEDSRNGDEADHYKDSRKTVNRKELGEGARTSDDEREDESDANIESYSKFTRAEEVSHGKALRSSILKAEQGFSKQEIDGEAFGDQNASEGDSDVDMKGLSKLTTEEVSYSKAHQGEEQLAVEDKYALSKHDVDVEAIGVENASDVGSVVDTIGLTKFAKVEEVSHSKIQRDSIFKASKDVKQAIREDGHVSSDNEIDGRVSDLANTSEGESDVDMNVHAIFAKAEEASHGRARKESILKASPYENGQTSSGNEQRDDQSITRGTRGRTHAIHQKQSGEESQKRFSEKLINSDMAHSARGKPTASCLKDRLLMDNGSKELSLTQLKQSLASLSPKRRQLLQETIRQTLISDDDYNETGPDSTAKMLQLRQSAREESNPLLRGRRHVEEFEYGSLAGSPLRDKEITWKVEFLMNDVENGGSYNAIAEAVLIYDVREYDTVANVILGRVLKKARLCRIYARMISCMTYELAKSFPLGGNVQSQPFFAAIQRTCWVTFSELIRIFLIYPSQRLAYHTQMSGVLFFIAELFRLSLLPVGYLEDVAQSLLDVSLLPPASETCIGCMCDFIQLTFDVLPKVAGGADFILRISAHLRSLSMAQLSLEAQVQISQLLTELQELHDVSGRFAPKVFMHQPISWTLSELHLRG